MSKPKTSRFLILATILLLGVYWVVASASPAAEATYPNANFLISAAELKQRMTKEPIVVIDVRSDEYFDGKMIAGAIRLPWKKLRYDSTADNMGGLFVGFDKAQNILGEHGVFRNDKVVLYDSVARDGGATASYVFWILDMLGHKNFMILERGIDGWMDINGEIVNKPVERESLLYQAPQAEIKLRRWADENFIYPRLGDPYYQIIDVRSQSEYLGEKLNTTLDKAPLKAGHIPGAYNINYEHNWTNSETKAMKSYNELIDLYRGINPNNAVIVYCHSARRGSFGYFALRLIGFDDVILYDNSWFGWGQHDRFYPVETKPNTPPGTSLPAVTQSTNGKVDKNMSAREGKKPQKPGQNQAGKKSGYISCGG